ncbi:MAG: serine hydrolase [Tissierellaceae bacterium]
MSLEKSIFSALGELDGTVGMYFEDLSTGKRICINSDMEFSAASTIKIPLVLFLLIKGKSELIDLGEQIQIDEVNRVGGTGIIKELDKKYRPTIMDLAKLTIILSDNIATNQIVDLIGGAEEVTKFCNSIGLISTKFQRKMMDFESLKLGKDNITTPRDMGYLLKMLVNDDDRFQGVSNILIDIMKGQQLRQKLPYLIPALEPDDPSIYSDVVEEGTVIVAHKTGELWKVQHDVGIFMLPRGHKYILALYTSNLSSDNEGSKMIAKVSKIIYDHMVI